MAWEGLSTHRVGMGHCGGAARGATESPAFRRGRRAGRYRARGLLFLLSGGLLVAAQTSSGLWTSAATAGSMAPAAAMLRSTRLPAPTMQSINAPARVARVAEVPGSPSHEAWAIGYTHGDVAGSQSGSALGQIVFLHYLDGAGWQVAGPPTIGSGAVSNPRLFDLSMGPSGEGWAVGENGVLVHHPSGGGSGWQVVEGPSKATLESVSVVPDGGGITGYAVGGIDPQSGNPTALRLSGGSWTPAGDSGLTQTGSNQPGLTGVAAVSSDEAWAVSGEAAQASTSVVSVQALYVFHRTGGHWHRVTLPSMFNQPPATANDGSTTIEAAIGGAVAADASGAWVVGRLVPNETSTLLDDKLTGDRSRPFAIWVTASESKADTFCPGVETVDSSGTPSTDHICANDFPLAAFGLDSAFIPPDAAVVDGRPELFAGGMGLFHYARHSWNTVPSMQDWAREPDSVGYIASISMASRTEGWVAGTGSNAIGGGPFSETLALGHWTMQETLPAVARWPDPDVHPIEAVALAPNGSHAALAVGQQETRLRYVPGTGWIHQVGGTQDLHALTWPAMGNAWAVGNAGTLAHYDGHGWTVTYAPRTDFEAPPANLFGVAFSRAGTGWAVGSAGAILDYAGRWRLDPGSGVLAGSATLYTVATIPGGAVAAGEAGTVLVFQGGSWRVDSQAEQLLASLKRTDTTFYASTSLPDGTTAIGGSGGVVLVRSAGGGWREVEPGLDGTVIALGLVRNGDGSLRYLASVDPKSSPKYVAGTLAATQGWVFVGDGTSWQDIELNHDITMWSSTDTAASRDPVLSFALEPGAVRGWATGGYPALTVDDENHAYESGTSTGSLYRLDLGGDPSPPSVLTAVPPPPSNGFTFAFLGDSACAAGLCGAAMGSGTAADVNLTQARQEIAAVRPDLTLFGGNMRGTGLPEELAQFKRSISDWPTPFYAAMGGQDLLPVSSTTPNTSSSACTGAATEGNGFYLNTFADEPGPWGTGNAAPGVTPYDPSGTQPNHSQARTHYAFDWAPPDLGRQARFVVLNDSDGCTTDAEGNPPAANAAQTTWLSSVLGNAKQSGLPTIVVMNQPYNDPRTNTPAAGSGFAGAFTANGVPTVPSALFSSYFKDNMSNGVNIQIQQLNESVSLPAFISGGAGSPFDSQGSHNPLHGYYHAWLLATVDTNPADRTTVQKALGQDPVTVQAFPILESVAMTITPRVGSVADVIPAGTPADVTGLGRTPDQGLPNLDGPAPDPAQTRAEYIQVPNRWTAAVACTAGREQDNCSAPYSIQPYRYFWSETPGVADFFKPCPDALTAMVPCLDNKGQMIHDHDDGFLCLVKPGTAWIDVLVGTHRARQMITVGPGVGDCNRHPPPPPPPPPPPVVQLPPNPVTPVVNNPVPLPAPAPRPLLHRFFHSVFQNNLVPAVIPPPVPVVAAAPPLPAAGTAAKKEEEREKALEHSQESSGHHQAVAYLGPQTSWDYRPLATAGAGVFGMFIFSAAWAASRRRSAAAIDVRRWE
jgi:hypothetical protein